MTRLGLGSAAWLLLFATVVHAESLSLAPFGEVSILRGALEPREVVLFLSGDGGWNLGVISMAQRIADKGAVVAGIDIRHYLAQLEMSADACVSPAADLKNLSDHLQRQLELQPHRVPTLVGYSSGATLVYATLVEAPPGSFKGALSLGFCPDLDLKKPVCRGSGLAAAPRRNAKGVLKGVNFMPAKSLSGTWIALQGQLDQVCPAAPTEAFIAKVPEAQIVLLPKVGHGYSVEKNWLPQFESAYERIAARGSPVTSGASAPGASAPGTSAPGTSAAPSSP
jgi:type IV secretory pathway VirJ component